MGTETNQVFQFKSSRQILQEQLQQLAQDAVDGYTPTDETLIALIPDVTEYDEPDGAPCPLCGVLGCMCADHPDNQADAGTEDDNEPRYCDCPTFEQLVPYGDGLVSQTCRDCQYPDDCEGRIRP